MTRILLLACLATLTVGCATINGGILSTEPSRDALQRAIDELQSGISSGKKPAGKTSVAIAGFTPTTGRGSGPFARYLVHELANRLLRSGEMDVADQGRVEQALRKQGGVRPVEAASATQLGKALGVDLVVMGTYVDLGGEVQVTEQIVSTAAGRVLAARSTSITKTKAVAHLLGQQGGAEEERPHPLYTRWWFWAALGGVVLAVLLIPKGNDRVASGPDGRYDPRSYPSASK